MGDGRRGRIAIDAKLERDVGSVEHGAAHGECAVFAVCSVYSIVGQRLVDG